ncbi:SpoIIE family protein phosphatase [Streptomyces sp. 142MFCol3.1]|uniref:SpoIIE family protein phosphatase n=1 Tax=Streptomyces sp. 142MFCol3.1 TaxID=1172179 RepID=UPI00055D90E5|nr:SpoIIE family protein phosphatase [Streptomyces sp. 142MFCol3.1]
MFALQCVIIVLLVTGGAVALVWQTRTANLHRAEDRSMASAVAVAQLPDTAKGLLSSDPTSALQPVAERTRQSMRVDFIAVLDTAGIRHTDSVPDLIGQRAAGNFGRALQGLSYTEHFDGAPQDAVRAVVPVRGQDDEVVGIVTAGVEVTTVSATLNHELPLLLAGAAGAFLLATAAAGGVGRRLSRQTGGLGPVEVTRMYEHHDAVLHTVREGVLVTDRDRRLVLANDEARRLLALPEGMEGRHIDELGLEHGIRNLLASDLEAVDEVHPAGGRLLSVNHRHTNRDGGPPGAVTTFRDATELRALAGRVEATSRRLEMIYDASARIGNTLDVTRTAEELTEVAVPRFADVVSVDLLDPVVAGEEPPAGVPRVLRRAALRGVTQQQALHPVGSEVPVDPTALQTQGLRDGEAVLVPDLTAASGWRGTNPVFAERVLGAGLGSLITVPMRARGTVLGIASFWRRGEFHHDDVSSAEELVARAAVCVDNARRYTREHALAIALQRSLLPTELPEQNAVRAAYRYLPAEAGVGGDWFDVIALPGARVALVVGDVVGHGLQAAATMGRLRTAVHNFAALDLPPDELITYLDELVTRLDQDGPTASETAPVTGATMLYAVYDPATGRCHMACAGHPPPARVRPDGTVDLVPVPPNLPLGLGNSPFETYAADLTGGTRLVLYTDGLVESREHAIDTGLDRLTAVLAGTGRSCDQMCTDVIDALLPSPQRDDIALLVAETRRLAPDRVAQWDITDDPAAVAPARAACVRQMTAWDIGDDLFAAELILSELITNAIRYGDPPITVRLLYDRYLTYEVSDTSHNAPHLRHAATLDEGGRGLFLIAQLADRWGTRYTPDGKTVWAEQLLTAERHPSP